MNSYLKYIGERLRCSPMWIIVQPLRGVAYLGRVNVVLSVGLFWS